jgi:hypothetical protein
MDQVQNRQRRRQQHTLTHKATVAGAEKTLALPAIAAPIQMLGCSIVKQFLLHINGVLIADSGGGNQAYRSYIESEFMLNDETKNSVLQAAGYYHDEKLEDDTSKGRQARMELCKGSRSVEMMAPIFLDLFRQPRLLANYLDLKLVVYLNSNDFIIENYTKGKEKDKFKLVVEGAKLYMNEWILHDGVLNAMERMLSSGKCLQYPLITTQLRTIYIAEGRTTCPENILFTSTVPSRLIIGLVEADSYSGKQTKCPFNFKNFDLTNIYVEVGNRTIPSRSMNIDYDKDRFTVPYVMTLEGLGLARSGDNNGLTLSKYKEDHCIYAFEVTPACHTDLFETVQRGITAVRMEFGKAIPKGGVMAVVYAEFANVLTLNKDRTPMIDTVV